MAEQAGVALISVFDKTGIEAFAGGLNELDWRIYASGGTFKAIDSAGIPVTDVAELVGGEAILGHKVVTLSREIAAGLLADYDDPAEMKELEELGIPLIDLVCQDSYPMEEEIAKPGSTPASVRGQSDIGGPNMLREAAKGRRIVLSVAEQREEVLEWLRAGKPNEEEMIDRLARRAVYEVASYTFKEAAYWNQDNIAGGIALKVDKTKYGENPYQEGALYADNRVDVDPLGLDQFVQAKGWELSFVNMTDMDRLLQVSTHIAAGFERNFDKVPPMAVGVKHGNPCGAAVAETHAEAVKLMLEGDTRAIFGGVVMINGTVDEELADILMHHATDGGPRRMLDGVVAAEFTDEALAILSREKLRAVYNPALANLSEDSLDTKRRVRPVRGGMLAQSNYTFVQDFGHDEMQLHGEIDEAQRRDLILAWAVGCTSNSNTISIVKDGQLIGNGVGQQDRIGAGQLALSRTTVEPPEIVNEGDRIKLIASLDAKKLNGAVAYSDSFFPFPDGPVVLADAGVKAILTSSGSQNDGLVVDALRAKGVSIAMIPDKVARGFFGH